MNKFCSVLIILLLACASHAQQLALESYTTKYEFVQNKGQWHPMALYKAEIPFGNLYLESGGLLYDMIHPEDYKRLQEWNHSNPTKQSKESPRKHALRMKFAGIKFAPRTECKNIKDHYYNYFIGNDTSEWANNIHPAEEVVYHSVFPDIDFEINGKDALKYQWTIHNPSPQKVSLVKIRIEGATKIELIDGRLHIQTTVGSLVDDRPFVYQTIDNELVEINAEYVISDSTISYDILSKYDPRYPLVIDPELIFSTYSGSRGDNFGFTATYDSKANLYAGGIVNTTGGPYPVTSGAYDTTWNGGVAEDPVFLACDISLSKYDSAGTKLLWATYLGGRANEYPHSLVVDRNDDLLILGTTFSSNYPTSTNCFDATLGGDNDIIVTKLSEDGASLLASTFIGGDQADGLNVHYATSPNYADDFRGDIITDDNKNIYVATVVQSDSLPVPLGTQSNVAGSTDGYIFELNPDCSKVLWGTYLGGSSADALYSIKLDQSDNIYVGGGSISNDIETSDSVVGKSNSGNVDGILAIYSKESKKLKKLTYWGTSQYDQIYFIDVDAQQRIYATGQTKGSVQQTAGTYGESNKGQFIFRIDTLLRNADFVTTFGNEIREPNLVPSAFLVDVCDHIYFSGWGSSKSSLASGSTRGMEITSDAEQTETDNNDFYILVLDKNAGDLLYATYFGGDSTADHVDGGTSRFDKRGVIYQSVCSSCPASDDDAFNTREISDFPTSSGAVYETNPSIRCSNASFKIDLQIKTAVIADFLANPIIGCSPLPVQFTNKSVLGDSLIWDFGDGSTSNAENPKHEYTDPGIYTITLTIIDSNTCNILSVYQRKIEVLSQSTADISSSFSPCDNELVLVNNSTNGLTFDWDFGDGNTSQDKVPKYKYAESGEYEITLFVNKGTLCESEITMPVDIDYGKPPSYALYNIFSPNNDGLNDCFLFDGISLECTDYKLKIYNRWGEKVFETTDPNMCWNGRVFNTGNLLPEATYYYVLSLGKNSNPISGIVAIVK